MRQRILQMSLISHLIRTDEDAMIRAKSASLPNRMLLPILSNNPPRRAPATLHITPVQLAIQVHDVLGHETNRRRVLEQVVPPLVAVTAVPRLVADVCVLTECLLALPVHLAQQDVEVVRPSLRWVVARLRRVIVRVPCRHCRALSRVGCCLRRRGCLRCHCGVLLASRAGEFLN